MNHFEEIGAKIEEKVDEAISKKFEFRINSINH